MRFKNRFMLPMLMVSLIVFSFTSPGIKANMSEPYVDSSEVAEDDFFFEDPIYDENYILLDEIIISSEETVIESLVEISVGIKTTTGSIYHDSIVLSGNNGLKISDPVTGSTIVVTESGQKVTFSNSSVGALVQVNGNTYIRPTFLVEHRDSSNNDILSEVYGQSSTLIAQLKGDDFYALNSNGVISDLSLNGSYIVCQNGISLLEIECDNTVSNDSLITYHINSTTSKTYRGSFKVDKPDVANALLLINLIDLESYLYGVVPREMPASWHMEALKVQAVAARSYSYRKVQSSSHAYFNICDTAHCQVYGGMNNEHSQTNQAVDSTRGEFAVHNNRVIEALYSSSSGGHTENSENVWSSSIAYLRGVPDPRDEYSNPSYYRWTKERTLTDIQARILANDKIDVGDITSVYASKPKTEFGRNTEVTVVGSLKTHVITSQSQMRSRFNLFSSMFDITFFPGEKVVFTGGGYGHGIGMSQYGARGMAVVDGKTYKEILSHYYTGVTIQKYYE